MYEVLFKATPYLFDNLPVVNEFVYELIIGKLEGPTEKTAHDSAIAATIAAICANFFDRQQKRVILFICDSSDGRQMTRARKFRDWFDRFNDSSFIKLDAKIPETADSYIFLSLSFSPSAFYPASQLRRSRNAGNQGFGPARNAHRQAVVKVRFQPFDVA